MRCSPGMIARATGCGLRERIFSRWGATLRGGELSTSALHMALLAVGAARRRGHRASFTSQQQTQCGLPGRFRCSLSRRTRLHRSGRCLQPSRRGLELSCRCTFTVTLPRWVLNGDRYAA
jgi:hypothetical protein